MNKPPASPEGINRRDLMLSLLQGQRETSDPDAMMRLTAQAIGRFLNVDRAGFFEVHGSDVHFTVGWTAGRLPLLTGSLHESSIGSRYLDQVKSGKTLAISDTRKHPLTSDSFFQTIGTISLIGIHIFRNGQWYAGFYVNHHDVREWTDDEISLARDAGEQTWDAVERARAVSELRKSEERLTLALEAGGGIGTWDWDIPNDRFYCNARFAELFCVPPELAAAGVSLSAFMPAIHFADRERVAERVQFAVSTGTDYSEEYRVTQKDGSVRWVQARGRCHRDANGIATRFPGAVFDITERRTAVDALQQQWHTFDTALSHTPDFTYIFDLQGRFAYINRALLSLWQKTHEEAAGKNFFELGYPPELAARLQSQIQQVIETGQALRDQTPFTGPDGTTRHYDYIFVPVCSADGTLEAVAGSTRDITEQRHTEDELRRMNRELEEFGYVASHDLQEPLRMVNIYTQLLLAHFGDGDPVLNNYARFIKEGVGRMEALLRDLLTFSRAVQADALTTGSAILADSIAEALLVLRDRIEETGATITIGPLPAVQGDTQQLSHVFQNLLSNSLKYCAKELRPEIHVSAVREGDRWIVSVRDNGIGFEPEYAQRIFGLFKRLHRNEYPGTGLGLAICQRIVERCGGRIWAEGELGLGSTFYFALPAAKE